jgi:endonuclease-3
MPAVTIAPRARGTQTVRLVRSATAAALASRRFTRIALMPARDRKKQARQIAGQLRKAYPDAECALHHKNAYQLIAATILSAQCTDERVNMVTPELFRRYPTPADLAGSRQQDVEKIVQSCGFFRAKATSLRGMAQKLVERFGGEVPKQLEELVALPGVGRKTANVVLGTAFGIATGVVVDTHVKRITRLLGLTRSSTPEAIEQDLMSLLPKKEWIDFSHRLIHHGRRICIARRPRCLECPLLKLCDRVGLPPLT